MTPPNAILQLVERFEHNRQAYRSGHHNATQVRREFIDPSQIACLTTQVSWIQ